MPRIPLGLTLALLLLPATAARAAPQVPQVPSQDLPVAGTCAPIAREDALWVTIGETGWYGIAGEAQPLSDQDLPARLAKASSDAKAQGTGVSIWIVTDRTRPWGRVSAVMLAAQNAGLFRVGLEVRAESGGGLFGFPLFLPPPQRPAAPAGTPMSGRLLQVRMEVLPKDATPEQASNPKRLFAAAQRAVQRFAPVVAELSLPLNTPVEDAVRAIDLLYRAGCAAVKLPYRYRIRDVPGKPVLQILLGQNSLLPPDPFDVKIPPIAPRKSPWPDDGAAAPGAYALTLEDLPGLGHAQGSPGEAPPLLPSYAEQGGLVPPEAIAEADDEMRHWGDAIGEWLARALQPGKVDLPATLLVSRKRQGMGALQFFQDARRAFVKPEKVEVHTVRLQAYLFRKNVIVGQVDVTADLSAAPVGVVFGHWKPGPYPKELVLPPRAADPYAMGVPGYVRVWLEGLLALARARGGAALPVAPEATVLAGFPAVAYPGIRASLQKRQAGIDNLAAWVKATPYDRVAILAAEGTAAVHQGGQVTGILTFDLEAEQGAWSLASLKPRAAR